MKKCLYCFSDINQSARKCPVCMSFQSAADEPQKKDLADLVIKFIGWTTVVIAIVGGMFAFIGFKSLLDFREQSQKFTEATGLVQSKLRELNNSLLVAYYARYDELMEAIVLDSLHKGDNYTQLQELGLLVHTIVSERQAPSTDVRKSADAERKKDEMLNVIDGLKQFKDGQYTLVMERLEKTSDRARHEERLRGAAYKHLTDQALRTHNDGEMRKYARKHYESAQAFLSRTQRVGRPVFISLNNLAAAEIELGTPTELENAKTHLDEALRQNAGASVVMYNLAIYHIVKNDYCTAMDWLVRAKTNGEFKTKQDVEDFNRDPWVPAGFRTSAQPCGSPPASIRERVGKLLVTVDD